MAKLFYLCMVLLLVAGGKNVCHDQLSICSVYQYSANCQPFREPTPKKSKKALMDILSQTRKFALLSVFEDVDVGIALSHALIII